MMEAQVGDFLEFTAWFIPVAVWIMFFAPYPYAPGLGEDLKSDVTKWGISTSLQLALSIPIMWFGWSALWEHDMFWTHMASMVIVPTFFGSMLALWWWIVKKVDSLPEVLEE